MKSFKGTQKIPLSGLEYLRNARNLLGFSAGVDSSALFFLLLAQDIDFDIAIVDYKLRKQSKKEVKFAQNLAKKYRKRIFIHKIELPRKNMECHAREVRYGFFEKIMQENDYKNLILAHQLNDRLEWFFMQLVRGAGLHALLGFDVAAQYKKFTIIRPLFYADRAEILRFLKKNHLPYFIDKTNADETILRNYFRHNFSNTLIEKYSNGVARTLDLLRDERNALYPQNKIHKIPLKRDFIAIFALSCDEVNLHYISLCAKELGYVISFSQRKEILKARYSCVIAEILIEKNYDFIFVTRYQKPSPKPKDFRESARKNTIPPKIRGIIDKKELQDLKELMARLRES